MYTLTFNHVLLVPMTYASIAGILMWRRAVFVNTAHKWITGIALGYLIVNVPTHAYISLSAANIEPYIRIFPIWYSWFLFLPYALFLMAFWQLRFKQDAS